MSEVFAALSRRQPPETFWRIQRWEREPLSAANVTAPRHVSELAVSTRSATADFTVKVPSDCIMRRKVWRATPSAFVTTVTAEPSAGDSDAADATTPAFATFTRR